ncbi:hypothetical protein N4R57_12715 [Rhodobacteraceae bacterium D3-12]|nr:hypothetical protein N4R57_12715 [Rhodobacteraceae bacterium D3-12]
MIREIYLLTILILTPAGELVSADTSVFAERSQCQAAAKAVTSQARSVGAKGKTKVSASCTPL